MYEKLKGFFQFIIASIFFCLIFLKAHVPSTCRIFQTVIDEYNHKVIEDRIFNSQDT